MIKRASRNTANPMYRLTAVVLLLLAAVCLSGCKDKKYEQAVSLYESGDYEAAYDIFSKIGDHKDANWLSQDCAQADIQQHLDAGDFDQALLQVEKYSSWEGTKWYQRLATYTKTAAAGSYIEAASCDNCLLSCVIHLSAPMEGQYVQISLSAPKDSNIFSPRAYTTRADEDVEAEEAADYFDVYNYAQDGSYVLEMVDISDFTYTIPAMSHIYKMGIFRPETQAMMSALSFLNPPRDIVSPDGVEGISFSGTIDYAKFNSTKHGPVDSISYAFAGGTLDLYIMSAEDKPLYCTSLPVPVQ
ncbi:MAG: hypothetical protein QM296_01185 [Bacillota bacterium]|nr:hypothetical protein [Bacillota bacterium]